MALSFVAVTNFAFATTYTCTDTKFSDLPEIKINLIHEGSDMVVTQLFSDGDIERNFRSGVDQDGDFQAELADWNGYTRTLVKEGETFMIDYQDECSGGTNSITCIESK